MDSGGYTYAKIDRGGNAVWVAGPTTKLGVGTKLGAMTGTLMTAFRSETLQRTFDQIWFISSFSGTAPSADSHAGSGAVSYTHLTLPTNREV